MRRSAQRFLFVNSNVVVDEAEQDFEVDVDMRVVINNKPDCTYDVDRFTGISRDPHNLK